MHCDTHQSNHQFIISVWSPDNVPEKRGVANILTCLDAQTGFANVDLLQEMTNSEVAMRAFAKFFKPNGLPQLVLVDR